jgi:hypothetical protein
MITLLHELVEHTVAHPAVRADLHALIREVPQERVPVRVLEKAS